jgi:6-hydroxytryprostatin B O-methyltransferase
VPLDGSTIAYNTLAEKLSLDTSQLKQMIRQLIPIHVFAEPTPGQITHTASSRLLATHPGIASYTGFMVEGTFPYTAAQIDTFEKWGHGRPEPNRTAVSHYYNTDLSMFEYFETKAPATREMFATLMTHMSSNPLMDNMHVARGFDWSSLPTNSVVVDVAGGMGHCSIPIAESTDPSVKLIVQDLPQIIAKAGDPSTCVIPEHLRPRFEFVGYNFYDQQPVKGAAVYFLRMIVSLSPLSGPIASNCR